MRRLRNSVTPLVLGFLPRGGNIGQRGAPGVGPGGQEATRRSLGGGRLGPWWLPSGPLLGSSLDPPKYWHMLNFIEFGGVLIQQLDVHFSPLNPASTVSAPKSCKLCKTSQNNIRTIL